MLKIEFLRDVCRLIPAPGLFDQRLVESIEAKWLNRVVLVHEPDAACDSVNRFFLCVV